MVRKAIGWMIGAVMVLVLSCGGQNLQRQEVGTEEPYQEFDPMSLDDDDVSLAEIWGTKTPQVREHEALRKREATSEEGDEASEEEGEPADSTEVKAVEMEEVQGWRVQIFASERSEAAQRVKAEAMDIFDVPVYLQFEVPYYRVQIGDCRTLTEAEELVRVAKRKGYSTSFRVRTLILVAKRSP